LPEADREPFLEAFNDLERKVAELEASAGPDWDKLIREELKRKPSRTDAPLMAAVEKALA